MCGLPEHFPPSPLPAATVAQRELEWAGPNRRRSRRRCWSERRWEGAGARKSRFSRCLSDVVACSRCPGDESRICSGQIQDLGLARRLLASPVEAGFAAAD
jgi:hypothetical protein